MKFKIILLSLAISVTLAASLYYYFFKLFYSRELSLRLSPLTENNKLIATNTKWWILGDSRIYQWNIPDTIIPQKQCCNLGVNSQTTAQVLYRLNLHLGQAIPQYIFFQVGINDLKAIGIFPYNKEAIIEQCISNIELIINTCIDHKVIPVFCTIFPPGDVAIIRRPFWSKDINDAVIKVNDSLSNFCKQKQVAIFDACSALNDGKGILIKKYQKDDLHLNEEGYNKLNEELAKFLTKENTVNKY